MNKLVLLFTTFILCATIGFSQSGSYMTSKHIPAIDHYNTYYGATIDQNGILYLATRNGLIKYDGRHTSTIDIGNSVFDVLVHDNGDLIVATAGGVCSISSKSGKYNHENDLVKCEEVSPVFELLRNKNEVYGLSDRSIYYKSDRSDSSIRMTDQLAGRFFNLFELDDHFYVNSENKGIMEVTNATFESNIPQYLENQTILFTAVDTVRNKYLVGNDEGELFVFSKGKLIKLGIEGRDIMDAEPIVGLWYDEDTIVVGTLKGGIFFINTQSGIIEQKVEYGSGLDDNEVVALVMDNNSGISAIGNKSVVHMAPHMPIRSFEYYEGLSGDISAIAHYNGKLYVGTNVGLYLLELVTDYDEVISYRNRRLKIPASTSSTKQKRRRKKQKLPKELQIDSLIVEKVKSKKIIGTHYQYKEVDPNISNVSQLLQIGQRLIVSGISGVFEIYGDQIRPITTSATRYIYLSEDQQKIFVCTGDDRVLVFAQSQGFWKYEDIFTDFRAPVNHIKEYDNTYWFSSPTQVFAMKISANELNDVEVYNVDNPYFTNIYGILSDDKLKFLSINNSFEIEKDSLMAKAIEPVENIILDNQNKVWALSNKEWQALDTAVQTSPIFNMLGTLKAISYNKHTATYWVVTEENKILNFAKEAIVPPSAYMPFIQGIYQGEPKRNTREFVISQGTNNKLSFVISHSDLPKVFDIKYRHKLVGLDNSWSGWSHMSTIDYNFLPDGKYELLVESVNAFGKSYAIDSIKFTVLPPYWQRPWFYTLEFAIVLLLFLITIKLKSAGYKYRLISRLLAFLTLVIVIEYLEAIMESYFAMENSPIFGFILQVIMAIIILPFEGILKKYVFKENIKLRSYFEIKEKQNK